MSHHMLTSPTMITVERLKKLVDQTGEPINDTETVLLASAVLRRQEKREPISETDDSDPYSLHSHSHWDQGRSWATVLVREDPQDSYDVWVIRAEGRPGRTGDIVRLSDGRAFKQVPGGVTQPTRAQARTLRVAFMKQNKVRRVRARDYWDYDYGYDGHY